MKKQVILITLACAMALIFCGSVSADDAPNANFTSNVTNGSIPLSVQFNDTSTGNPTSWKWDFGDNSTSNLQNPVHNYTRGGNYTVSLTAINSVGNSTITKVNYIQVSNLITTYQNIYILMSNHNGTAYSDGGPANTYYFVAGGLNQLHLAVNPSTPSGQVTTSSSQSGVFYITTTGGRGSNDDVILLLAVKGPIPDNFAVNIISNGYVWIPGSPSTSNYVIGAINETFTKADFLYGPQTSRPASASMGMIYKGQNTLDPSTAEYLMFIDLKVGNINSATSINGGAAMVQYTFTNLTTQASFDTYAWATGYHAKWSNDASSSGYNVIGILDANFTTNTTSGAAPLDVQCTDKSSNSPTSWLWDFGDGITSTLENPSHVYSTPGNYTVRLTATNAGGSYTQSYHITVLDVNAPVVDINLPSEIYNTTKSVTLNASDDFDQNPVIYYSTDNGVTWSNATKSVTWDLVEGKTIIQYYAEDNYGNKCTTQTATYTIDTTAPTTTIDLASGIYSATKTVTLTATDNLDTNPVIYYSTDNGVTWSNATKTVTLNLAEGNTVIQYYAGDAAGNNGTIQTLNYTIDTTVPIVNASLSSGSFNTTQTVNLTATDNLDQNPVIYYTTDGTTPTTNSTKYTGPVSINTTTTLKFIAVDAAGNISPVQTETYNIKSDVYVNVIPSETNLVVGNNVTYTFKVGNKGPGIAQNVVFTYVIPEGLQYNGATVDQGNVSYDAAARTLTWDLGNVTVGDPYLWLNVSILSAGSYNLQPTVSTSGYDPELTENIGTLLINATLPVNTNSGNGSDVTVNAAAITKITKKGSMPMQDTGLPLNGLISALLLVGSGLALSRKK